MAGGQQADTGNEGDRETETGSSSRWSPGGARGVLVSMGGGRRQSREGGVKGQGGRLGRGRRRTDTLTAWGRPRPGPRHVPRQTPDINLPSGA